MEGGGGVGDSSQDITRLENLDIGLKYLTCDARDVVVDLGLHDLRIRNQVLLMEHCYNYSKEKVRNLLVDIEAKNIGVGTKDKMQMLGYALSNSETRANLRSAKTRTQLKIRMGHRADFSINGIGNLLILDRSIVIADYQVKLDALSQLLNSISTALLMEWINTSGLRCPMQIALYRLQEFCNVDQEERNEVERLMAVKVPHYPPTDARGIEKLEQILADLRSLKRDNAKLED